MKSRCAHACGCCDGKAPPKLDPKLLEEKISQKEKELKLEFEERLHKESEALIERFNYILQNEQVRSTYMLREAQRERHEKITALRQQLECNNLAGLMYVMCAERIKSKLEKMQIIEQYTNYINKMNTILSEGQELILNLSRGYKTAARVDSEWREKMNAIVYEFQQFIYHYSGTPPEQNQYFFDLPKLLKTEAPIKDDPLEDPIEEGPPESGSKASVYVEEPKTWWEKLDDDGHRPFIVFGDLQEFKPDQRREVLKIVKAEKTAPARWKEYVFHDMFLESKCPNADQIKHKYFDRLPDPQEWDCSAMADLDKRMDKENRRVTTPSVDFRGNMGSILKIITNGIGEPLTKANLLGARDSMEITSTTRLREKSTKQDPIGTNSKVEIKVGNRRTSFFYEKMEILEDDKAVLAPLQYKTQNSGNKTPEDDDNKTSMPVLGALGNGPTDSLQMIAQHVPDRDSKITYNRICPMEKCQGLQYSSFTRGLPKYMREGPFSHFETTYENYETCSPEQIELIKEYNEQKKMKNKARKSMIVEPLLDWQETSLEGMEVQTSHHSRYDNNIPPCTCEDNKSSLGSSDPPGAVYKMEDMITIKRDMDEIKQELMWDNSIQFDRFKVIGGGRAKDQGPNFPTNWTRTRVQEIGKILKKHPSLLDIFQANTRC